MSILNKIESLIVSQFPEAIIHVENLDEDIFIMIDKDTYSKDDFKVLALEVKLDILFKSNIANIFIVMDKENRKFNHLVISVNIDYEPYKTGSEKINPDCDYFLAA